MDGESYAQGDLDFSQRCTLTPPPSYLITLSTEQLERAGEEPTGGWPAYSALYPERNPAEAIRDPVFVSTNFLISEVLHGWVLGEATDPLASALKAAKAVKVGPGEFRAPDENAQMTRPLIGRGFQVWGKKERGARNEKACHDWRLGVRLGPQASGVYSQRVSDIGATPPGIRRAGFRAVP